MTIQESTYDVLHRLSQISDDQVVESRLVQQWLNAARLSLLGDYFKENGEEIPPSMLKRVDCTPLQTGEKCDGCPEQYVDLPYNVLSLSNDIGVFSVQRPGGKEIDRYGGPGLAQLLSGGQFSGVGYARVGNRINIYGRLPSGVSLTLWLIPAELSQFESTDDFPAPSDLMGNILEEAEKIGRRRLGIPVDVTNDGSD